MKKKMRVKVWRKGLRMIEKELKFKGEMGKNERFYIIW